MDERVRELEEETEKRSAQFGGLDASTSALGSNSWPITLQSVVFCVLGDKTSSFLFCSRGLPPPLTQVLPPTQILPPPPLPLILNHPLKKDPGANGKPNVIHTSQRVALPRTCGQ